jgi:hypothetical protein
VALGQRLDGDREPVVAQDDRLEVERQVAQLADRVPLPLERLLQEVARLLVAALLDEVEHRIEHQADSGQRLHGTVVQEERDPPPLVLLGSEDLVRQLANR